MFIFLKNSRYMQYIAAFTATLTITSSATFSAWPSPTLSLLTSNDSPLGFPITNEEASWIVSTFLLVSIPFALVAGWLVDKIGRKFTLLLTAIPLALPWILIIFAKSIAVLCLARGIAGIGLSIATIASVVYNSEIADNDIRGRLSTFYIIMRLAGNFLVFSTGPFVSYTVLALICFTIPVLFSIIFFFMPESPYYLVKIGKTDEARKVLFRLMSKNNATNFIEEKMKEIELTIEGNSSNKTNFLELFKKIEYRKPLIIMAGIKALQQLNGIAAIEPYMQTIIESSDSSITPEVSSIILGLVPFPAAFLTGAFVDRLGRKPILIISTIGCAIFLLAEGSYFFIQDFLKINTKNISWLPSTALIGFIFMNPLGIATLPYVIVAELFPTDVRGIAASFGTFEGISIAFLLSRFFFPMSEVIGMYSTFWMYSGCCFFGSIFVYFMLPETKGKAFADIQVKLRRNMKTIASK